LKIGGLPPIELKEKGYFCFIIKKSKISTMIKVGILDDHQIIIQGIQSALDESQNIQIISEATSKDDIFSELENLDVLLLDINLRDDDGITVCKQFKKSHPDLKIICLTSFLQVSFIKAMLRNGADGYLFKNVGTEELIKAIETVYGGDRYLGNEVNNILVEDSLERNRKSYSFIPKLTRRENEILDLIINELTNQQIADKLFISLSTVETHRMNLCAKLGAKNTAGMVRNAIKFGLA